MKFSAILKHLREEKGINQTSLANAIGVSRSTIGMYEAGLREPDFETMEAIADFFNVDMNYLHGIQADPRHITSSPGVGGLTEGEEQVLELFRRIPEDRQKEALDLLELALRMQQKS